MIWRDRIIIALDNQNWKESIQLMDRLQSEVRFVKIGMELYYSFGPQIITEAQKRNYKIFLDLKLHDIPTTVMKAIQSVSKLGLEVINVHAAGGAEMMRAARQGAELGSKEASVQRPLVIAVTQLTSTEQRVLNEQLLISGKMEDVVVKYAALTKSAGLDGVVASALEIEAIKQACGDSFITITPGIRPIGSESNDQKRISTPYDALVKSKGDYIVIGRPITMAPDPLDAFKKIIGDLP